MQTPTQAVIPRAPGTRKGVIRGVPTQVYMTPDAKNFLKALGAGNVSRGIREAIALLTPKSDQQTITITPLQNTFTPTPVVDHPIQERPKRRDRSLDPVKAAVTPAPTLITEKPPLRLTSLVGTFGRRVVNNGMVLYPDLTLIENGEMNVEESIEEELNWLDRVSASVVVEHYADLDRLGVPTLPYPQTHFTITPAPTQPKKGITLPEARMETGNDYTVESFMKELPPIPR